MNVRSRDNVRSGEFTVGNFVAYRQSWDGTLENSKLAYTPLYPPDYVPGHAGDIPLPTLTARRLDTTTEPISPATLNPAWAQSRTSAASMAITGADAPARPGAGLQVIADVLDVQRTYIHQIVRTNR